MKMFEINVSGDLKWFFCRLCQLLDKIHHCFWYRTCVYSHCQNYPNISFIMWNLCLIFKNLLVIKFLSSAHTISSLLKTTATNNNKYVYICMKSIIKKCLNWLCVRFLWVNYKNHYSNYVCLQFMFKKYMYGKTLLLQTI